MNAELAAARAREAATREILQVIGHSRDDEGPVFDMILENACRLCNTPMGDLILARIGDTHQVIAAQHGTKDSSVQLYRAGGVPMDPSKSYAAQAISERKVIHLANMAESDLYRNGSVPVRHFVDDEGIRTILFVPLIANDEGIGVIALFRLSVDPFHADEIALVETFAAQAVIAIENVRQFRELQTRLERESATRNILRVIAESPDDEQPTFEAILDSATRLCGTPYASLVLGRRGDVSQRMVAHRASSAEAVAIYREGRVPMDPEDSIAARAILEGRTILVPDMSETDQYRAGHERFRLVVDQQGLRTNLFVPLLGRDGGIGCFFLWKKEVAPFTNDQIALIETFAAQAVIAIENVRQFRAIQAANAALQTRLTRDAATREVLEVISRSRDDDQPVFESILEQAAKLCNPSLARLHLANIARSHYRIAASWGQPLRFFKIGDEFPLDTPRIIPTTIREGRMHHIPDLTETENYRARDPRMVAMVEEEGYRTFLTIPLMDKGVAIGCITLVRAEVAKFSAADIALVETFSAQAVIAIENVRQFRELQARLEREAATRDILEVISQNRNDDRPVFDLITRSAALLCGAPVCTLWRVENGIIHYCASHGLYGEALAEAELTPAEPIAEEPLADNTMTGRVSRTRAVARIDDATDESYIDHEWARARGLKYLVGVPIFVGGEVWGSINPMWPPDRPPRDADIQLVESFAAQAAIAIENVRQFKALERLNAELGERVNEQVGEIERMGRLKRFLPSAVADAVVSSGSERMLSSHRALLGVLFCDIRGFTAFCETAEPEETIEVLQTYHEEMGKLINAHGAGVDHRMGDGIMVLFNDPLPCDDPAGHAVRLALAMRDRMVELCRGWKKMGHRLGFGVGVSLGYATVGMVGSGGRFDYTASGTAINLASRLADEAQDGEILLSPRARTAVEDQFPVELRGELTLKGIREPVEVFRLAAISAA